MLALSQKSPVQKTQEILAQAVANQKHCTDCLILTTVSALEATHTCLHPAKLVLILLPLIPRWPTCLVAAPVNRQNCGLPLWAPRKTDSAHLNFVFSLLSPKDHIDTCVRRQHRSRYTPGRLNHSPIRPSHHPPPPCEPPIDTRSLQSSVTDVPILPRLDATYTLRRGNLQRDKNKERDVAPNHGWLISAMFWSEAKPRVIDCSEQAFRPFRESPYTRHYDIS